MGMFSNPPNINDDLPDSELMKKVLDYRVQDSSGVPIALESIIKGYGRTILIFIRHLHCGSCMSYVTSLSENETLKATTKPQGEKEDQTKVIIIGHGTFEGINWYKENAECPFAMYVDQTKKLHKAFGFTHRYLGKPLDKQPEYFRDRTAMQLTWASIRRGFASGTLAFKGGDIALLGGEIILDKDSKPIFIHRMRDTQDHTPVEKIADFVLTSTEA